ncbi:MAG: hypothetical protein C4539_06305 [Ignavibacteriales bacterium]|nr:MAG: hypothetical protein C4539_06305 [Ignavibacteriales bacterium]
MDFMIVGFMILGLPLTVEIYDCRIEEAKYEGYKIAGSNFFLFSHPKIYNPKILQSSHHKS